MILQDVIARALIDANFADELRYKAIQGQKGGRKSKEWKAFMEHFAKDSEQLMNFTNMYDKDNPACTGTTGLTMVVTSTALCTLTTTTMTTSIFCDGD
jgi:hypothetical protein